MMIGCDPSNELRDDLRAQIERRDAELSNELDHFLPEHIDGAIRARAVGIDGLLLKTSHDALRIDLEHAARARIGRLERQHRHHTIRRTRLMRMHQRSQINVGQIVGMRDEHRCTLKKLTLVPYRASRTEQHRLMHEFDAQCIPQVSDIGVNSIAQVMRVDYDALEPRARERIEPVREQRATRDRRKAFRNVVCQWRKPRT
ncbi:hypothetical protein WJ62_05780 [Burkholderia diffusa]|nr:hypothetical protein WJ62_05780 [Burkholderia diffusa]